MGADSTLVIFGIRIPIAEEESTALEENSDPRITAARNHGLAHWWGSFSIDNINEQEYLYVGKILGNVGHEGVYEIIKREDELDEIIHSTRTKLSDAGFIVEPKLYVHFEPDY